MLKIQFQYLSLLSSYIGINASSISKIKYIIKQCIRNNVFACISKSWIMEKSHLIIIKKNSQIRATILLCALMYYCILHKCT